MSPRLAQKFQSWRGEETVDYSQLMPKYRWPDIAAKNGSGLPAINEQESTVTKSTSDLVIERFYSALDAEDESSLTLEKR